MDAIAVLTQASAAGSSGGGAPLDIGVVATVIGVTVTASIVALIVARALRLHRTSAARRSVGPTIESQLNAPVYGVMIEPKPRQHQRAA
jgi:hypothetical protein